MIPTKMNFLLQPKMLVLLLFLNALSIGAGEQKIQIGFLSSKKTGTFSVEERRALAFISKMPFQVRVLQLESLRKPEALHNIDILWWHEDSLTTLPPASHDPRIKKNIKNFVANGKGLLLTLLAAQYAHALGVESTPPNKIEKGPWKVQDTYKEVKGYHSYDGHPIFADLFGGAYVWNTKAGYPRAAAYYDSLSPTEGKIAAIGWDYITLNENERHIIEYKLGAGTILTIGSFLHFADENNVYRPHLEKFTTNVLNWLNEPDQKLARSYWNFKKKEIKPAPTSETVAVGETENHSLPKTASPGYTLRKAVADSNYFDVSGSRTVIMGKQIGGLDAVWVHPFRILTDLRVGLSTQGEINWLGSTPPEITAKPEAFVRKYPNENVTETLFASRSLPGGVLNLALTAATPQKIHIEFSVDNRIMWPYEDDYLGDLLYATDALQKTVIIKNGHKNYVSLFGAARKPEAIKFAIENKKEGVKNLRVKLTYAPQQGDFNFIFVGTNQGMAEAQSSFKELTQNSAAAYQKNLDYYTKMMQQNTVIVSPDSDFNNGYKAALLGVDKFYIHTPELGSSFMAGFGTTARGWNGNQKVSGRPGYAWYFGRDAEWTAFAVNAWGDFEKVRGTLAFLGKHQDITGKILHEFTSSGAIHYDAADATPLYVVLMGKYFRASGDLSFVRQQWDRIKKAMDFCYSTDTDGDALIENTNVGHGWVEGGTLYGAHTTFYMAGSWAAALQEASIMANHLGRDKLSKKYARDSKVIVQIINRDFWDDDAHHYKYGKLKDGSFNAAQTVMPAIPIAFSVTNPEKSQLTAAAFSSNEFSTNWGVRILQESHPKFHPKGYHYGSVWPLYTGWAALAEFKTALYPQGFSHVMNNFLNHKDWGLGLTEEVLHGMKYEPIGVCANQAWSESAALHALLEGMVGIDANALDRTLTLHPWFPADWDFAEVKNIHIGDQKVNMRMQRRGSETSYHFTKTEGKSITINFKPVSIPGAQIKTFLVDGKSIPVENPQQPGQHQFVLADSAALTIMTEGGVEIIPFVRHPEIGEAPYGLRFRGHSLSANTYGINLEGVPGQQYDIKIRTPWKISTVTNGTLLHAEPEIKTIRVRFAESARKYIAQQVTIIFQGKSK